MAEEEKKAPEEEELPERPDYIEELTALVRSRSPIAEPRQRMDDYHDGDLADLLEQLHRAGCALCVASATAEPLMDACLTRLGVGDYFRFLLSCETVGAGKNQPDVYFEAARRLGCAPEEAAVYEDALYAAETAKRAGFYTVGVYDESAAAHWARLTAVADETLRMD